MPNDKDGSPICTIQEAAAICDHQVCTPELKILPHIPYSDLKVGRLLGEGGFSSVFEVRYHNIPLALKKIRRNKRGSEVEDLVMAIFDLCNEATILGKVSPHENIVSIQGVCQASVSEAYMSHPDGWFFLEEKLHDTLANRLNIWRRELQLSASGPLSRLRSRDHSISSLIDPSHQISILSLRRMYDRLQEVALGVANAMSHLHSQPLQIAFRDLKPQNIGFDSRGVVKLFDLGMARPIQETKAVGVAGTYRYLSPEALLGKTITLESDVYSFGVILYELVTLAKPYDQFFERGKLKMKAFCDDVVVTGWRPDLSDIPCRWTAFLISKCWDPSPSARPSFQKIHRMIERIVSGSLPSTNSAAIAVS